MSTATRQRVVDSLLLRPNTPHKADLLDPNLTSTWLIDALDYLIKKGHHIEVTCVNTDHHDDGPRGHSGGRAIDCWPNKSQKLGDYHDADSHGLRQFLVDFADHPKAFQIGVSGDAIAGSRKGGPHNYDYITFTEQAPEHIHIGVRE